MAIEIERKFLVNPAWRGPDDQCTTEIIQGYLNTDIDGTVRLRVETGYRRSATLTIKGRAHGASRTEHEFELHDPGAVLDVIKTMCTRTIRKIRTQKLVGASTLWTVDEFLDDNQGLILAEVELEHEDQDIEIPRWCTVEVTNDARYYNSNLAKEPYSTWKH